MVTNTPRLGLDDYELGDTDWDHSDLVQYVEEHAVERDTFANRPASGEYDGEPFLAEDRLILYRWDAGTTSWEPVAGMGTADNPLPGTVHRESVATDSVSANVGTQTIDNIVYKDGSDFVAVSRSDATVISTHTDPADAINAALDALPHSTGTSTTAGLVGVNLGDESGVDGQITLSDYQGLKGLGRQTTILRASGTNANGSLLTADADVTEARVKGMAFDAGANLPQAATIPGASRFYCRDCTFIGGTSRAFRTTGSFYSSRFEHVLFNNDSQGDRAFRGDDDINGGVFDDCQFSNGGTAGLFLRNNNAGSSQPRGIGLYSCTFTGNGSYGGVLYGCKGITITNPYVEDNGFAGLAFVQDGNGNDCISCGVEDGWFWENAGRAIRFSNSYRCRAVSNEIDAGSVTMDHGIEIQSGAKETRYQDNSIRATKGGAVTSAITDGGTRSLPDGVGENAGDPSSTGQWNGNGYEGATVVDTTNSMKYIYRGGAWV